MGALQTARSIMNLNFTPFNTVAVSLLVSSVTIGALVFTKQPQATDLNLSYSSYVPNQTSVAALKLTSETTGYAVVRLDEYTLDVSFDYEKFTNDYGVPGSEFDDAMITSLTIDKVHDVLGNSVSDFTDHNDHYNINQMLITHMHKNRMLGGV